jgi:hypothetical protein
MIPKLGSITLPKQKRIRDMLDRLGVRERPLKYGHRLDQKKVLFILPFANLIMVLKGYMVTFVTFCSL